MRFASVVVVALLLSGCNHDVARRENGTTLLSKDFPDKEKRIGILKRHVKPASEIHDAEFNLFNVNGFGGSRDVPGASSWNYKFAVKVDTADVKLWSAGLSLFVSDTLIDWMNDVGIPEERKFAWKCSSEPKYYRDQGILVIMHAPEGIVYKVAYNN